MAESAVTILVPEAEPVVGHWRLAHDPSAAEGVPAHVTLLYPFVPFESIDEAVEAGLESVFAAAAPFSVSFSGLRRFPGVLWLAPDDPEPLVALTLALMAEFPACLPYGGAHDTITPHLTVAQVKEGADAESRVDRIEADFTNDSATRLPIRAHVVEAWLLAEEAGGWRLVRPYRFGAPATPRS